MVGYVKNFSWDYTTEGGYECSVSLISTGEILESLQIRFDPQQRLPRVEFDLDKEASKEQRKSIYHYFVSKLQKIEETPFDKDMLVKEMNLFATPLKPFTGYYYYTELDGNTDDPYPTHYIPIRLYFDIFNKHVSLLDLSKTDESPDSRYVEINTDFTNAEGEYISSKYLTSPEHFSIDPTVCVLPKVGIISGVDIPKTPLEEKTAAESARINESLKKANVLDEKRNPDGSVSFRGSKI